MPKPLLPSLNKDANIAPPTVGGWYKDESDLIKRLSSDMKIGFSKKDEKDIKQNGFSGNIEEHRDSKPMNFHIDVNSIPDIWAHPILFETALYDSTHLLHTTVLGEWRGLIALIAFKEMRLIDDLIVKDIVLDSSDRNSSGFLKIAKSLLPSKSICSNTRWGKLHAFLYKNHVIGFTSPTTLVCTAPDNWNKLGDIKWSDGRYLEDPIPKLNDSEKLNLVSWLEDVRSNIHHYSTEHNNGNVPDELTNLLKVMGHRGTTEGFIGELLSSANSHVIPKLKLSNVGLGLTFGVFSKINNPLALDSEGALNTSHVRLIPSVESEPKNTVLVIDKNMWGKEDSDVILYGSINLSAASQFSGIGSSRNSIGKLTLPQNIEVWRINDLFTEKLYLIEQQGALPGTMPVNGGQVITYNRNPVTPILPLNKELLKYLTPEDINRRTSFTSDGSGITVFLRLPLSGSDNLGQNYEFKKTYLNNSANGSDNIRRLTNIPLLNVWPNLIKQSNKRPWKNYYTYCRRTGINSFYCEPIQSNAEIIESIPYKTNGNIDYEIYKTNVFPEAMSCTANVYNQDTRSIVLEYAGIILLRKPEPVVSRDSDWKIGIDFGTAGTTVYYTVDNGAASNIVLKDRMLKVTDAGSQETNLYNDFLPPAPINTPFLSIFHYKNPNKFDNLSPLMDGHIYFLQDFNEFKANNPGIQTNLKWGETKQRTFAGVFLEQLCLQCAAEAVVEGAERAQWRYSYPTAFSTSEMNDYVAQWGQIVEDCNEVTGLQPTDLDSVTLSMTESLATARYFKENRANLTRGYVCIDIGGGTTDISIWQSGGNQGIHKLQTSIKFAGRDMILNIIRKRPEFLRLFNIDNNYIKKLKDLKNIDTAFFSQAEALITNKWEEIQSLLPIKGAEQEVRNFLSIVAFAMGGLLYYVGILIRHLSVQNPDFLDRGIPNIYIGGNGSKILHWLARRNFDRQSLINRLFKSIVADICGYELNDQRFEINISPEPKSEAAKGLVCSDSNFRNGIRDMDDIKAVIVSGEDFISGDSKETNCFYDLIEPDQIRKGIKISPKLPNISKFIQIFNEYASIYGMLPIEVDEQSLADVCDQIQDELNIINADEHVDPLFIMGIKKILEMKSDEWAV